MSLTARGCDSHEMPRDSYCDKVPTVEVVVSCKHEHLMTIFACEEHYPEFGDGTALCGKCIDHDCVLSIL